jgi:hypothetical protein
LQSRIGNSVIELAWGPAAWQASAEARRMKIGEHQVSVSGNMIVGAREGSEHLKGKTLADAYDAVAAEHEGKAAEHKDWANRFRNARDPKAANKHSDIAKAHANKAITLRNEAKIQRGETGSITPTITHAYLSRVGQSLIELGGPGSGPRPGRREGGSYLRDIRLVQLLRKEIASTPRIAYPAAKGEKVPFLGEGQIYLVRYAKHDETKDKEGVGHYAYGGKNLDDVINSTQAYALTRGSKSSGVLHVGRYTPEDGWGHDREEEANGVEVNGVLGTSEAPVEKTIHLDGSRRLSRINLAWSDEARERSAEVRAEEKEAKGNDDIPVAKRADAGTIPYAQKDTSTEPEDPNIQKAADNIKTISERGGADRFMYTRMTDGSYGLSGAYLKDNRFQRYPIITWKNKSDGYADLKKIAAKSPGFKYSDNATFWQNLGGRENDLTELAWSQEAREAALASRRLHHLPIDEDAGEPSAYRIHDLNEKLPKDSTSSWSDSGEKMGGVSGMANMSNALDDMLFGEKESATGDNYTSEIRRVGGRPGIVIMSGKTKDAPGAEVVVPHPKIADVVDEKELHPVFKEETKRLLKDAGVNFDPSDIDKKHPHEITYDYSLDRNDKKAIHKAVEDYLVNRGTKLSRVGLAWSDAARERSAEVRREKAQMNAGKHLAEAKRLRGVADTSADPKEIRQSLFDAEQHEVDAKTAPAAPKLPALKQSQNSPLPKMQSRIGKQASQVHDLRNEFNGWAQKGVAKIPLENGQVPQHLTSFIDNIAEGQGRKVGEWQVKNGFAVAKVETVDHGLALKSANHDYWKSFKENGRNAPETSAAKSRYEKATVAFKNSRYGKSGTSTEKPVAKVESETIMPKMESRVGKEASGVSVPLAPTPSPIEEPNDDELNPTKSSSGVRGRVGLALRLHGDTIKSNEKSLGLQPHEAINRYADALESSKGAGTETKVTAKLLRIAADHPKVKEKGWKGVTDVYGEYANPKSRKLGKLSRRELVA